MCNLTTPRLLIATVLLSSITFGQAVVDWHHTGSSASDLGLAGLATGPVNRVWFANGAATLLVQTVSGRVFTTSDFENWQRSTAPVPPVPTDAVVPNLPEPGARTRSGGTGRVYGFGNFVYRSDNGGVNWENVTSYRGVSIVGSGLRDLAINPDNPEDLIVAGDSGVFRSVDGGRSWSGLNDGLPNLAVTRLLDLPSGDGGLRLALLNEEAVAWPPGDKLAWLPASNGDLVTEAELRSALTSIFDKGQRVPVTAITIAGDFVYAGLQNGEIRVSADRGLTYRTFAAPGAGAVERFWVDAQDPRVALAALGEGPDDPFQATKAVHVLHTVNGGAFWDDFTANLPDVKAHGVAGDRASGALYVATDRGVFLTYADLGALGTVQTWTQLAGLPDAAAMDVKLDAQGNQLWTAVDGYGVYSTLAPHRLRDPKVVSAADLVARAVAPGSLVSILGAKADSVRVNNFTAPLLATTETESQVQIPFEAVGSAVSLDATSSGAAMKFPALPLAPAAPVIFISRDGSPMLLDADKGVLLDAVNAAHSGSRIQILATGLGRVAPEWPSGTPAPFENSPHVAGTVHAYLDRAPVEVTRAELAPGYIGFYLIEISVPKLSNYGPAELYLDVDGAASNRVRVYIEP